MKERKSRIRRGKIEYQRPEPKVIRVNLSLFVGIIFAILIVLSSSFLGYKVATVGTKIMHSFVEEIEADESLLSDEDTENYEDEVNTASTVSDDGTSTSSFSIDENYKATDELTNEDKEDEYQKNYQETTVDDDNYLIKTAEWTDKENGEALITINGSLTVEPEETTALYVTTICYAHGLTENIIVENIQYLAENYDNVDFIVVAYNPDRNDYIYDTVRYDANTSESTIRNYLRTCLNNYGFSGQHFTYTIIPALEYYLFGGLGDSYISEDNMINDPLAIYVSFDGFYNADYVGYNNTSSTSLQFEDDTWAIEYATETFFEFLDIYFGDAYMTMSIPSTSSASFLTMWDGLEATEYDDKKLDAVLGLLQPENYGLASTIMTDELLEKYNAYFVGSNNYLQLKIASLPEYRSRLYLCRIF